MTHECIELNGPEVIHFIQENQINPQLLEDLAQSVMRFETRYSGEMNQVISSSTDLRAVTVRTDEGEHDGYMVTVHYYKQADPKDPSGWHTRLWFLTKTEEDKINGIWELGENIEQADLNESALKMSKYDVPLFVPKAD